MMGRYTNVWQARLARWRRRSWIAFLDARRAWSWHVRGGKRFYVRHAREVAAAHRWCFIVGCNNSGTTLLHDMLASAPNVSALRHEGQIYTRALLRAERRGHERVWSEFLDELKHADSSTVPRLVHDWMEAFGPEPRRWLLEKTTANAVRMPWLQEAFPASYFIAVVRNGFAVAEGIRRKGRKSVSRAARHWAAVNGAIVEDAALLNNFFLLSYEQLTQDPDAALRRIEGFLGWEEGSIRPPCPIRDQNAGSLARLDSKEMAIIRREAGEMLVKLNYPLEDLRAADLPRRPGCCTEGHEAGVGH